MRTEIDDFEEFLKDCGEEIRDIADQLDTHPFVGELDYRQQSRIANIANKLYQIGGEIENYM